MAAAAAVVLAAAVVVVAPRLIWPCSSGGCMCGSSPSLVVCSSIGRPMIASACAEPRTPATPESGGAGPVRGACKADGARERERGGLREGGVHRACRRPVNTASEDYYSSTRKEYPVLSRAHITLLTLRS